MSDGARTDGAKNGASLKRWMKFNFVGAIGIAVQFAALFLLKTIAHLDYLLATALAVEAAVVHNFIWHEQFTWADRVGKALPSKWIASLQRFARFNVANGAISILGNVSLMRVLVGFGHMHYLVASALAIALCSVANFLVSDAWVFQNPAADVGLDRRNEGIEMGARKM